MLSFTRTGPTCVCDCSADITSGAAAQLTVTTQPSATAQSGVAFAQQPAVQVRDASGNAVSQAGVTVTAAIATGGGTLGGTLTATTNGTGVGSFPHLTLSGTAGGMTPSAFAKGATIATSPATPI